MLASFAPAVFAAERGADPDIKGKYAVVMDRETGRILYEKDSGVRAYPASTTKLMTALLAVENLDAAQEITASRLAVDVEQDGSALGLKEGEILTVEQLLYALLVHSANDAANVLAEAVSGDIAAFVERMNQRALELGMDGTHFANPHGYHDDSHYTTAADLAKLLSVCLEKEKLQTMLMAKEYTLPPTNLEPQERRMVTTDSMITDEREYGYVYDPVKGGKTGHTSNAGYCFAAFGERNNKRLITVIMGSVTEKMINYSFYDTKKLMEYGFNNFSLQSIATINELVGSVPVKWGAGSGEATLFAEETLTVLLAVDEDPAELEKNLMVRQNLTAPVQKGDILGTVEFSKDGFFLGKVNLVAAESVKRDYFKMIFGTAWSFIKRPVVLAIIVALFIWLMVMNVRKRKKRREMRMKKRKYYKF